MAKRQDELKSITCRARKCEIEQNLSTYPLKKKSFKTDDRRPTTKPCVFICADICVQVCVHTTVILLGTLHFTWPFRV